MEELNTTTLEAVMEAVIQKDIPMDYGPWKSFSKEVCAASCHALLAGLLPSRCASALLLGRRWQLRLKHLLQTCTLGTEHRVLTASLCASRST